MKPIRPLPRPRWPEPPGATLRLIRPQLATSPASLREVGARHDFWVLTPCPDLLESAAPVARFRPYAIDVP